MRVSKMHSMKELGGLLLRHLKKIEVKLQSSGKDRIPILFPDHDEMIDVLINSTYGLIYDQHKQKMHLTKEQAEKHYFNLIRLVKTYRRCAKCVDISFEDPDKNLFKVKKCMGSFLYKIDEQNNAYFALCNFKSTLEGVKPLILESNVPDFGLQLYKMLVRRKK